MIKYPISNTYSQPISHERLYEVYKGMSEIYRSKRTNKHVLSQNNQLLSKAEKDIAIRKMVDSKFVCFKTVQKHAPTVDMVTNTSIDVGDKYNISVFGNSKNNIYNTRKKDILAVAKGMSILFASATQNNNHSITLFLTPTKKSVSLNTKELSVSNINSGYASYLVEMDKVVQADIVVWRKEEWEKVLAHEIGHTKVPKTHSTTTEENEAYVEYVATLVELTRRLSKKRAQHILSPTEFNSILQKEIKKQIMYTRSLVETLKKHNISWGSTNGRAYYEKKGDILNRGIYDGSPMTPHLKGKLLQFKNRYLSLVMVKK